MANQERIVVGDRQTGIGMFAFFGVVVVLGMLGYFVMYTRPLVPIPVNDAMISNQPTQVVPVVPATPVPANPN